MNITVEKLPNCLAKVRIEMPGETRKDARAKVLRNYVQQAALPGFRKGKAPQSVVEKKFGADIDREVADQLFNKGLNAAVEQENLKVLSVTDYNADEETNDSQYVVSLQVVLAPEVTLPDYKGLEITVPLQEVTDESVAAALEQQRERLANLVPVERAVKAGDIVTMDYSATLDGTPVKDMVPEAQSFLAENKGYRFKVDEGSFLPGFCAQLEGLNSGESRDVAVTMPADGVPEELAGKAVTYHVRLLDIQEAELPELNDEFAARVVPGRTLEELRGIIRENLDAETAQKNLERKRVAAMVALRDKVEFDLPPHVVHNATQRRVTQLVRLNLDRGLTQDMLQENEQQIIAAANEQARVDVKDEFILMEIVARENLAVTRDDMGRRIGQIAYQSRTTPDKVVKTLRKNDGLDNLQHSILLGKALDVLVEHATVTPGETPAADAGAGEGETFTR